MEGVGGFGLIVIRGDAAEFLTEVIRKEERNVRELLAVESGHTNGSQSGGNFGNVGKGDAVVAKAGLVHQGRRDGVGPGERRQPVVLGVGLSAAESTRIFTAQRIDQGGVVPEKTFGDLVLCSNDAVHVDIELVFVEGQRFRNGEQSKGAGRSHATWGRRRGWHKKPSERSRG